MRGEGGTVKVGVFITMLAISLTHSFGVYACSHFEPSHAYITWRSGVDEWLRLPALPMEAVVAGAPEAYERGTSSWEYDMLQVDCADLLDAVPNTANVSVFDLIKSYREMRTAIDKRWPFPTTRPLQANSRSNDPGSPLFRYSVIRNLLPIEFRYYTDGAIAFRQGDFEKADECWKSLLALPEEERHFRSTWASYMLGRSAMSRQPDDALAHFARCRALFESGFHDSAHLADTADGWAGHIEFYRGNFAAALAHYVRVCGGPDPDWTSLEWTVKRILNGCEEPFQAALVDPGCRQALLAGLAAGLAAEDVELTWWDRLAPWTDLDVAGLIARRNYDAGRLDDAERWCAMAKSTDVYAQWIRAKLALRAGHGDEALILLQNVLPAFPLDRSLETYGHDYGPADSLRVRCDLSVLYLRRTDFLQSMTLLYEGGDWKDVAYLAERVLTIEELKSFIDARGTEDGTRGLPLEKLTSLYLRRLWRGDRLDDVIEQTPAEARIESRGTKWRTLSHLLVANRLRDAVRGFRDASRPVDERINDAYVASVLYATYGHGIMATEMAPDWESGGRSHPVRATESWKAFGRFSQYVDPMYIRAPQEAVAIWGPTAAELERYDDSSPAGNLPPLRYVHLGAEYCWEGAALVPSNDSRGAYLLWQAGTWLKYRDPEAADVFYKALVRRNRRLPVAQEADRMRWFPKEPPENPFGPIDEYLKRPDEPSH